LPPVPCHGRTDQFYASSARRATLLRTGHARARAVGIAPNTNPGPPQPLSGLFPRRTSLSHRAPAHRGGRLVFLPIVCQINFD